LGSQAGPKNENQAGRLLEAGHDFGDGLHLRIAIVAVLFHDRDDLQLARLHERRAACHGREA